MIPVAVLSGQRDVVLKRLPRREDRLSADDAFALHLFDLAGGIGCDPVPAQELDGFVTFVGDSNRVVKTPFIVERLGLFRDVARLGLDTDVVGDGFRGGRPRLILVGSH